MLPSDNCLRLASPCVLRGCDLSRLSGEKALHRSSREVSSQYKLQSVCTYLWSKSCSSRGSYGGPTPLPLDLFKIQSLKLCSELARIHSVVTCKPGSSKLTGSINLNSYLQLSSSKSDQSGLGPESKVATQLGHCHRLLTRFFMILLF